MSQPQERLVSDTYEVFDLSLDWLPQVLELEKLCSLNPWSEGVLKRELERGFSLRPGISHSGELIAQSFSYLVVDELHILNISVHPKWQGLGLGKYLLAYNISRAISQGAKTATLEVRKSNEIAKSLYAIMGFKLVGTRVGYYQNNGEDALVYESSLEHGFSEDILLKTQEKMSISHTSADLTRI